MRTFIKHTADGEILEISQVDWLPEGVEHPLGILGEGEYALEIELGPRLAEIPLHDLHDAYRIDAAKNRLVRRRGARTSDGG
jgi:hypothetical protein